MIRVLVIDDHAVVRRGLEQLLTSADGIEVVGSGADGSEAITLAAEREPDVILMDLSMPGVDGISATRSIMSASETCRIIVLTSFAERAKVLDALSAGAIGYLLKDSSPDEIIAGVRAAAAGESPLDPKAAAVLIDARRGDLQQPKLSPRELEVLRLVRDGFPNKRIAQRLAISERTVKAHLTSVFQQLGVGDRTQAALWAKEHLPD